MGCVEVLVDELGDVGKRSWGEAAIARSRYSHSVGLRAQQLRCTSDRLNARAARSSTWHLPVLENPQKDLFGGLCAALRLREPGLRTA